MCGIGRLANLVVKIVVVASAFALVTGINGCASVPGDESGLNPNIIVILADDIGAEAFGCYGGESYETPHIDRMAREGVRFDNAFTQPLCTPTRVELLTGRSNARNYVAFSVLDPRERTFAEVFQAHGYATMAVGKWQLLAAEHYPPDIRGTGSTPEDAGFDAHVLWQVESLGLRHWNPTLTRNGVTATLGEHVYGPAHVSASLQDWIDERGAEPFMVYWPMILPHDPFLAPPGSEGPRFPPGDVAQFGAMVAYLDRQVGDLLRFLESSGRAENTLVLFIGDNGSPRQVTSMRDGVPIKGGKRDPTDHGSRVPFIAWGPGSVAAGRVDEHVVSTVDVFATVLDYAGLAIPEDRELDSVSVLARLRGEDVVTREAATFHYHPRPKTRPNSVAQRWARDADWQLFDDGRLFHVSSDPQLEHVIRADDDDADAAVARQRLQRSLDALPRPSCPQIRTESSLTLERRHVHLPA